MAIVLDNRVMGRPPVIQSAIGTRGQITMGGAICRQRRIWRWCCARVRCRSRSRSLMSDHRTEPRAGLHQRQGMLAGMISIVLVIVAMLFYYRFSGALAVAGLFDVHALHSGDACQFGAVLTLPGIAGLVLSSAWRLTPTC
jgi:preprotein translocase subunit SecD